MKHLIQITMAQLNGKINPTDSEIISAINTAIAKEQDMTDQLFKSYYGDRKIFDAFTQMMANMLK